MTIVTSHHRPKRAPRKKRKQPAIVLRDRRATQAATAKGLGADPGLLATSNPPKRSALVEYRPKLASIFGPSVPDDDLEEHQRRGDAADGCGANWCGGRPTMAEASRPLRDQVLIDAAALRRHSTFLLAHARQLREEAEGARVCAVQHREASEQALASLQEKRSLSEPALGRHASRLSACQDQRDSAEGAR